MRKLSLEKVERYAQHHLKKHGLKHIEVTFSARMTRALGQARYNPYTKNISIKLNKNFCLYGEPEMVKDTVLHEIAHCIDYTRRGDSAHDSTWKAICLETGANPSRTKHGKIFQDGYIPQSKYVGICPKCGHKYQFGRKPKYDRSCGICKEHNSFDKSRQLEIIQNY